MIDERYRAAQLSKNLFASKMLEHVRTVSVIGLREPPKPPTRWQRLKWRLEDYRERVVTAWRVLRGDDIHKDCDY